MHGVAINETNAAKYCVLDTYIFSYLSFEHPATLQVDISLYETSA